MNLPYRHTIYVTSSDVNGSICLTIYGECHFDSLNRDFSFFCHFSESELCLLSEWERPPSSIRFNADFALEQPFGQKEQPHLDRGVPLMSDLTDMDPVGVLSLISPSLNPIASPFKQVTVNYSTPPIKPARFDKHSIPERESLNLSPFTNKTANSER